jgi:uncharacterized RmlC-like cupin family protein
MSDNVKKTDYGYEIKWANTESYYSKILVFEHPGTKTPMTFHKEKTKTWFVNSGNFRLRWVNTKDGALYEHDLKEGSVFHVPALMPTSIECMLVGSSIAETGTIDDPNDDYKINSGTSTSKE